MSKTRPPRSSWGGVRSAGLALPTLCITTCLWTGGAAAAGPSGLSAGSTDVTTSPAESGPATGPFAFMSNLQRSNYALGDLWGLRPYLAQHGMTLTIQETSEILGNATGGVHQGADYDGLTTVTLQLDTQRAFGWYGGSFNISALQIHGRSLSADNLANLQTASGIEADRSTRLWELWYQQKFLEDDRLDVKIGQQSLDQEFITSQNASYFINTMYGWPMLPSADLPGGGPAYPLSALGVRVRAHPTDSITLLAGVFNGSPVNNNNGDPQKQNPSGTSFPLHGGQLAIAEIQYAYPGVGAMVGANGSEPLSRTYKLGAFYDSERFDDLQYDTLGRSLANPASNGDPRQHRGNFAIYGVADQMVWRSPENGDQTLYLVLRAMGTPYGDRNLIDFSLNAGLILHSPFESRGSDTVGLGMGYAHVGGHASGSDRDAAFYNGGPAVIRGGETFIEATYQYQATPWLQLQPDVQYVFNPGAGTLNPNGTGEKLKDELILGVRTNILF